MTFIGKSALLGWAFFASATAMAQTSAFSGAAVGASVNLLGASFKYTDIDTIAITAPAATGLALSVGSMMVRQGNNGSAIGIKGTSNLLSASLFDVVDTSTSTGSPAVADYGNYTVSVTASGVNSVVKFTSSTASSNVTDLTASYKLLDNDTFKWATGDAAGSTTPVDVIKDFTEWSNSSGDRLDILGLLTGYTSGTSILSDWVTVAINQTAPSTSTANSTKIDIDIDGLGTDTVKQIIWLEGVTLSTTDVAVLKANGVLIA